MRELSNQEKRTIRFGAIALTILVVVYCGLGVVKFFTHRRADYQQLLARAEKLKEEVKLYDDRIEVVKKLMEASRLDPSRLSRTSVVAEASAAIQKAATGGGVLVGPVRESPARASGKELTSVQIEGTGPVQAVMGFMSRLETVGYPLIIDAVQLTPDMRPGQLKFNLTILILDFEQFKKEGSPRA